ncbi:unnamed protein product [Closterium sp. NIES-54]
MSLACSSLSSLTVSSHPISDYYHATRPVVSLVLASLVIGPHASPSSVTALTAAIADFAATRHLDYATRVVAAPPPYSLSVGVESAFDCDVLEDRQFELRFLAAASPSLYAMLLSFEGDSDALHILTPRTYREASEGLGFESQCVHFGHPSAGGCQRSTGDPRLILGKGYRHVGLGGYGRTDPLLNKPFPNVPPPRANIVNGMWIFKVKWPPGSPPVFKAHYMAKGFKAQQTTSCIPRILHFLSPGPPARGDTAALSSWLHWHFPPWDLVEPEATTLRSPLCGPITGPFPNEPFDSSCPYAELVGYLMRHRPVYWTAVARVAKYLATTLGLGLVLGGREPVVLTGHCDSSYTDDVETQRSTQRYCFSLGAGAVSWRSTRSLSVASSSAEVEIYTSAMAARELRWLTFLLTELGEWPRCTPALFADNKAMILLC